MIHAYLLNFRTILRMIYGPLAIFGRPVTVDLGTAKLTGELYPVVWLWPGFAPMLDPSRFLLISGNDSMIIEGSMMEDVT